MLWDHKYELGISEIDEQHQEWLALTTKLLDALMAGTVKANISVIFQEAFIYTQTHLQYEEELMAKNDYPDLERHKQFHADLISHLQKIKKGIDESGYRDSEELLSKEVVELVEVFQGWLVDHIEIEDKKYVAYVR